MKKTALFLLFLLTITHCSRQQPVGGRGPGSTSAYPAAASPIPLTDREKFSLKGNVKQWTRESYSISDKAGNREKRLLKREIRIFDDTGRQLKVMGFNEKAELISAGYTSYTAAGQLAEEKYYDGTGTLLVQVNYVYDAAELLIREIRQDFTGNIVYTSRWIYDTGGRPTEFEKNMNSSGHDTLQSRVVSRYDNDGHKTSEERNEYANGGTLHFKTVTHYNLSGNITEQTEYDNRGGITYRTKYKYDKNGNLLNISEDRKHPETGARIRTISVYTYDKNGNRLSSREPDSIVDYEYDKAGNLTETTVHGATGQQLISRTLAQYDDKCIKRSEKKIYYAADGKVDYSYEYTFNEKAQLLTWARYNAGGQLLYSYRTLYDGNGNKTEEVEDSNRQLPRIKYRYAYDAAGNHTETECYQLDDKDNLLLVMTYEYSMVYGE